MSAILTADDEKADSTNVTRNPLANMVQKSMRKTVNGMTLLTAGVK
jgi:hypothetical protein